MGGLGSASRQLRGFSRARRSQMHTEEKRNQWTYDRQDLQPRLFPSWQLLQRKLQTFDFNTETSGQSVGRSHPHIWVWCVLDFRTHRKALQLIRQDVKHNLPGHKRSRTQGNLKFISRSIIVPAHLLLPVWDGDAVQSGHFGWVKIVQSSVDMPSVEASNALCFIFGRDDRFMESFVRGVLKLGLCEPFVVVHDTIADELDLGYGWDGLEIGMENRLLSFASFVVSVAVVFRLWVESL